MATRTTSGAGNWSDTATWNGEAVPVAGDAAVVNHAVVWDVGQGVRIPATSGDLLSLTGTGTITVGGFAGQLSLNVTTITAGANAGAGLIAFSGTTGTDLTVNCTNITAGASNYAYAIEYTSTDPLFVNASADIAGGTGGDAAACLRHNSTGTMTTSGHLKGGSAGSAYGLWMLASGADWTHTGNITGGTKNASGAFADAAHGVYVNSSGSPVISISNGDITGGNINSHGVFCNKAVVLTLSNTNLINSATCLAMGGYPATTWTDAAPGASGDYIQPVSGGSKYGKQPAAGEIEDGIWCGDVEGTLVVSVTVNGIACGSP